MYLLFHLRSYQKKCSRDTAEKGAECIAKLTGPAREMHTERLADALNANDDQDGRDDDVQITQPHINEIFDDASDMNPQPMATVPTKSNSDAAKNSIHADDMALNEQPMEQIPVSSSSGTTSDLLGELETIMQPEVHLHCIDIDKSKSSQLIVSDNIEVKKEELEGIKRLNFTEEEDSFIKEGISRYKSSKTKWADILKDPDYKFHPTRTRDTLRVRSNYLKTSRRSKRKSKVVS